MPNGSARSEEDLLRIAGAIADGSPVNWEQELEETPLAEGPWNELRTIESIAAFHAPDELTGSATAELPSDVEKADHLPTAWGSLIVRELLGKGACANVFRAYDPALDREVALKLPHQGDPSFARSFLREARRLARIHHDSVVQVHGADESDGQVGMWMDLVKGLTLEEYLSVHGPFSASEATLVGIDMCRALAAIHGAGLVHRDLKAANVMREEGGRIVLMDFSSVVEVRGKVRNSNDSSTQGTPYYMAPELLEGGEATKTSDIYSLGVLLFRLVTGHYPVEAKNLADLHQKLDRGGATLLLDARPDLPVGFVEVIDRALASDPDERFSTAGEMEHALGGFAHLLTPPSPEPSEDEMRRPSGRLLRGLMAATVIGIAILMIFVMTRPAPLSVEAALFRRGVVADERLTPGDQLALGDKLFLEITGSELLYVYVLNEDAAGQRHRLFPLEALALENPLSAGVEHRLPGSIKVEASSGEDDLDRYWEVTTGGGEETLMMIAATEPLEDLERRIGGIPPVKAEPDVEADVFRGIGGLAPELSTRPKLSLEEIRAELERGFEGKLEIWQIRLANPPASTDG